MRSLLVVCAVCLGLAACGDQYDSATKQSLDIMEDFAAILEKAEPGTSAEDLKGKLEPLAKKMEALQKQMKDMPDPSSEREKALEEKYGERQKKLMERLMKAMAKHSANAAEIGEMLDKLMK